MVSLVDQLLILRRLLLLHSDSFDFVATVQESKDEHGNKITEAELLDQLLVLLFAGHDTVTSTSCSLLFILGSQPEIKARLLQEINETFPVHVDEPLDYDKLMSMTYLEAFIKEVLRVYPPVNGGFRETTEDAVYGDYVIPKGAKVLYSIPFTNGIFDRGDSFNPNRFLAEEGEEEEEKRFLTFGKGPHMCIGFNVAKLEMKVLTVGLLRGYQLEMVRSTRSYFPMFRETPEVLISRKG